MFVKYLIGVFVIIFAASVIIFAFVFLHLQAGFFTGSDPGNLTAGKDFLTERQPPCS